MITLQDALSGVRNLAGYGDNGPGFFGSDLFKGAGVAAGLGAVNTAYNKLGNIGERGFSAANELADISLAQSEFKPYTVTSGVGSTSVGPQGTTYSLSPEQQALQAQLGQGAASMFGQAMQGTQGREQEIFNAIRAMQSPEEQRQRLMMEERLQNQGRLGVRTSMFGGTPEQFSMDQAQAEARNQAALMAMQQGQAQQAQQANIGQQFLQGQYMPQAAMLQQAQLGLGNAQLAQNAQQFGAGMFGEARAGGLDFLLGSSLGQANLMGNVGAGLLSGLFSGGGATR